MFNGRFAPGSGLSGDMLVRGGADKLTPRRGLALLDGACSALYADASAHSGRIVRSKDAELPKFWYPISLTGQYPTILQRTPKISHLEVRYFGRSRQ